MPPDPRPLPRFIADHSTDGPPYGRFAEKLAGYFRETCAAVSELPEGTTPPDHIDWFPERAWGGRVWVPATAFASTDDGEIEFFGHVSYIQPVDGEPHDFRAGADFTDVFAEDNPDWRIDLNDEVIGRWNGEADFAGDVTLIWGRPLVTGSAAVTAELEDNAVDQAALAGDRFTLIALDALHGYGDPLYVEVKLWNRRREEIASETLYESDDEDEQDESADAEGGPGNDGESDNAGTSGGDDDESPAPDAKRE